MKAFNLALSKAVASSEDSPKGIVKRSEDVERVRRVHRNDLENIPPFLFIAFIYLHTDPSTFIAVNLIRLAAIARLFHTIFYAIHPMQPVRTFSFMLCFAVTAYMAISTAINFC